MRSQGATLSCCDACHTAADRPVRLPWSQPADARFVCDVMAGAPSTPLSLKAHMSRAGSCSLCHLINSRRQNRKQKHSQKRQWQGVSCAQLGRGRPALAEGLARQLRLCGIDAASAPVDPHTQPRHRIYRCFTSRVLVAPSCRLVWCMT